MVPTADGAELLSPFNEARPFTVHSDQVFVRSGAHDVQPLAMIGLPFSDPRGSRYASVLTDPMGRLTTYPGIIERRVGRGRVVFATGPLEAETPTEQRDAFARLASSLFVSTVAVVAPPCIEVTLFSRPDLEATTMFFFNSQASAPPVPVRGIRVWLAASRRPAAIRMLPGGETLRWDDGAEGFDFEVPVCETLAAVCIDW